jgi:ABC-type glutathione transport system ATPase component
MRCCAPRKAANGSVPERGPAASAARSSAWRSQRNAEAASSGTQMTSGSAVALSLSGVTKAYGAVRALDGLTLDVPEGRFFVLFGPSTVGKTTTLRAVSGLVRPDSGSIRIGDRDVTNAPIKGRGVSMVFQSFTLYPRLTVFKNLAYPLIEDGVPSKDVVRRVREATCSSSSIALSRNRRRSPGASSSASPSRLLKKSLACGAVMRSRRFALWRRRTDARRGRAVGGAV